jgi:hypothetical protein
LEKPENKGAGVRPHPCFRESSGRWFIFREVLILIVDENPALTDIPDKEFIYKLRNDPRTMKARPLRFRVIPARLAGRLA